MLLSNTLFNNPYVNNKKQAFYLQVFSLVKDLKENETQKEIIDYIQGTINTGGPYCCKKLVSKLYYLEAEYSVTSKGYKLIEDLIKKSEGVISDE